MTCALNLYLVAFTTTSYCNSRKNQDTLIKSKHHSSYRPHLYPYKNFLETLQLNREKTLEDLLDPSFVTFNYASLRASLSLPQKSEITKNHPIHQEIISRGPPKNFPHSNLFHAGNLLPVQKQCVRARAENCGGTTHSEKREDEKIQY